jgi:hypothetical protein
MFRMKPGGYTVTYVVDGQTSPSICRFSTGMISGNITVDSRIKLTYKGPKTNHMLIYVEVLEE